MSNPLLLSIDFTILKVELYKYYMYISTCILSINLIISGKRKLPLTITDSYIYHIPILKL